MGVSDTVPRSDAIGNGATDVYDADFPVLSLDDLAIYETDTSGTTTEKTIPEDYTAVLNADRTATLTRVAGDLPEDYLVAITGEPDLVQPIQLSRSNGYRSDIVERALDRATLQAQSVKEMARHALRFPLAENIDGTLPAAAIRAGMLQGYAAGTGLPVLVDPVDFGGGGAVGGSSFGLINAADAPYSATGNGITDDTNAIQAAYDAAKVARSHVVLTAGTYIVTDELILLESDSLVAGEWMPSIIGVGKIVIRQNNDAAFAFAARATMGSGTYVDMYQWKMSDIKIEAKNGISFGDLMDPADGDFGDDATGQAEFLGATFQNVTVWGTYGSGVDANYNTQVVPTRDELEDFGIGMRFSKCFDFKVNGGWMVQFGIAVALIGTDISAFNEVRFQSNARHSHYEGVPAFGSQTKFDHCEFLGNFRKYGVYNKGTTSFLATGCFFENGTEQSFIREDASRLSTYIGCRFNALPGTAAPWCTLSPLERTLFADNRWNSNGISAACEVLTTNWTVVRQVIVEFIGNDASMPVSKVPGVRIDHLNPYLFSSANFENLNGAISDTYPWEQDGDQWVVKGVAGTTDLVLIMNVPHVPDKFTIRLTAKVRSAATTPAGAIDVRLLWNGDTAPGDIVPILGFSTSLTDKDNYVTVDYVLAAPENPDKRLGAQMIITPTNDTLRVLSLEMLPFTDPSGQKSTRNETNPERGTLTQGATHIDPDYPDVDAPTDLKRPLAISAFGTPSIVAICDYTFAATITLGWHVPIHAGSDFRTGYVGANGGGLTYDASLQNDVELGAVGTVHIGTWSDDPVTAALATFADAMRVLPSGRVVFGERSDADPGSGKVGVYGGLQLYEGGVSCQTLGDGISIKSGANSRLVTGVVLVGGTKVVANTSITSNSIIFPTRTAPGGTTGSLSYTLNPGVGFTLNSTNGADTSTCTCMIVEQIP